MTLNGSIQSTLEEGRGRVPPVNGKKHVQTSGGPHYGTVASLLQDEALEVNFSANGSQVGSEEPSRSGTPIPENAALLAPGGSGVASKKKWFASWFTPSFVVIALVVLNGDMARGALFPTLWPLVFHLGGDKIVQGYVVSAFSFGRLIASPYIGRLSEIYGYRRVLVATSVVLLIGTLLYASATSIWQVLAAQIAMGLGSGTLGVTRAYVSEQTAKKKRTVLLAYLTAVQYAGFTVTPLIGGLLSDLFKDIGTVPIVGPLRADLYTSPALFMSIMTLMSIILLLTVFEDHVKLHESSKKAPTVAAAPVSVNATEPAQPAGWLQLGRQDLVILGAILLNVATKGSIAIYETLGIEFARSHFAMSAPDAGFMFAMFGFMGVIALVMMKRLVKVWNDVELIWGGMALMVACDLILVGPAHFPVWRFYLAIFLMYSIGYPVGHTAVIGMFSKVLGRGPQGYLMGWFGSAGSLARVLFPIIGGHMAQNLGYNWLFVSDAVLLAISIVIVLFCQGEILHHSESEH